jgi:uncharacterized SAM-binding protein YcdF (DUF218 family)
MATETLHIPEQQLADPDLLIVLGKNIGLRSTPDDIRGREDYLSDESRMTTIAAGLLYRPGMQIIFSGGHTAGGEAPAEAAAMRAFFFTHFPDIPRQAVSVEEASIDTLGNASEVMDMLLSRPNKRYQHIGLLSVGYHLPRSSEVFKHTGIPVEQTFASEEIIKERADDPKAKAFVERWGRSRKVQAEKLKEGVGRLILKADPDGQLLRQIAKKSRR